MKNHFKVLDEVMGSHFMLKLFFLILAIITMVTALNLTVSYEHEYLNSTTGPVLNQFSGTFTYVIMVIVFIYFLLWIIYQLFRLKMTANLEEEDE